MVIAIFKNLCNCLSERRRINEIHIINHLIISRCWASKSNFNIYCIWRFPTSCFTVGNDRISFKVRTVCTFLGGCTVGDGAASRVIPNRDSWFRFRISQPNLPPPQDWNGNLSFSWLLLVIVRTKYIFKLLPLYRIEEECVALPKQ